MIVCREAEGLRQGDAVLAKRGGTQGALVPMASTALGPSALGVVGFAKVTGAVPRSPFVGDRGQRGGLGIGIGPDGSGDRVRATGTLGDDPL